MISSGFFAEDGFHPSTSGYRAWAAQLAGPVALAAVSTWTLRALPGPHRGANPRLSS